MKKGEKNKNFGRDGEYLKEITEKVSERRKKSEYTKKELEIYYEGKSDAFIEILNKMYPEASDIYDKCKFTHLELRDFCEINVEDSQRRLHKARQLFKSQSKLLRNLTQLSIE